MGDASEMSSVQSAFEDLVLENPNRRKMEVCLLATMMMIVISILGLCIFVFVKLNPRENVKDAPAPVKISLFHTTEYIALYHRLMGWVSWGMYPCHGIHAWACSRRAYESPELSLTYTSQEMGREGAIEFFNMAINADPPPAMAKLFGTQDIWKKKGMLYMTTFMSVCTKGTQKIYNQTFLEQFVALVKRKFSKKDPFLSENPGPLLQEMLEFFAKSLLFFPFHKVEMRLDYKKELNAYVHPMKFILPPGTDYGQPCSDILKAPYNGLAGDAHFGGSDGQASICEVEKKINGIENPKAKASKDKGGDAIKAIILQASPQTKDAYAAGPVYNLEKLVVNVFGFKGGKYNALKPLVPLATQECNNAGPIKLWNYAMFKIALYFTPLWAGEAISTLGTGTLPFAAKFMYNREKTISPMLHCASLAERYFRPGVLEVAFWMTGSIKNAEANITDAVKLTLGQQAPGIDFLLKNDPGVISKSPSETSMIVGAYADTLQRLRMFSPPIKDIEVFLTHMDTLPDPTLNYSETKKPFTAIDLMVEAGAKTTDKEKDGHTLWPGDIFSGEVLYDAVDDYIYIPLGVGLPPFFHINDQSSNIIAHTFPSVMWPIITAALHRVVSRGFTIDDANPPPNPIFKDRLLNELKKRISCYIEKGFKDPAMAFLRKAALEVTYSIYHKGYNKKTAQADAQYRVSYIQFISEEAIFYLSAAQAFCKVASTKADKEVAKQAQMMLDDPFSGTFYQQSLGCSGRRAMSKEGCSGMFFWKKIGENFESIRVARLQK